MQADWTGYYPGEEEPIPPNAPEPLGKAVQMECYVDLDHAGDLMTQQSRMGVLIYPNKAPILWHSKKQASIKFFTFRSDLMALKTVVELICGL